ncbi:hypothetical protein [Parashewanella tropica]|uniref:hypothetical protein n=1 Tax=Parashewanella tropica TaxID=2547970 RepID=UPI0010595B57|nr:hypothetical protein [Parashewanella tropica]
MNINITLLPYLLIFTSLIPALLAIRLAKKQKRSAMTSGAVTFAFGFTWIGGWLYLAVMNFLPPKRVEK